MVTAALKLYENLSLNYFLENFIDLLKKLSKGKPVGIKICLGNPEEFENFCYEIRCSNIIPDFITLDCSSGGSGSAPYEYMEFVGQTLQSAIPFVDKTLKDFGLRDEIKIIASGRITYSADIVAVIALGADLASAARPFMVAMGCVQALDCASNNCPTGIATQNKNLSSTIKEKNFSNKIANFHKLTMNGVVSLTASLGLTSIDDISSKNVCFRN